MTKQDYTHLTIVVDRSGSMNAIREDAEGGINSLIAEQAKVEGEITVSLYEFDDRYDKVLDFVEAAQAPTYSLVPRGMTALYDATGRAIVETGEALAAMPEDQRPERVVFTIVTDGAENASHEYNGEQVKILIDEQTNKWGWEFLFIGAEESAFDQATKIGIAVTNTVRYASASGASANAAYGNLSASLINARTTKGASVASTMPDLIDDEGNAVGSS